MKRILKALIGISPFKISMVVALLTFFAYVSEFQIIELFELRTLDARFISRGQNVELAKQSPVTIIAIDEKTLEELGRWPFSRSYQADLVKALREYDSRVIAFDIIFSEPDQNSELQKVKEIRKLAVELGLDPEAMSSIQSQFSEASKKSESDANQLASNLSSIKKNAKSVSGKQFAQRLLDSTRKVQDSLEGVRSKLSLLDVQQESVVKLAQYLQEAEKKADNDAYFARVLAERDDIVLGYFIDTEGADHSHVSQEDLVARAERVLDSKVFVKDSRLDTSQPPRVQKYSQYFKYPVSNIDVISNAAPSDGHFNQIQDPDGAIRWYPAVIQYENSFLPSLGMKAVEKYLDAQSFLEFNEVGEASWLTVGEHHIPLDPTGRSLLNYRGRKYSYNIVSFTDVVHKRADPALLKDKIALIGPTAIGIYDLRNTPYDPALPGVEIHATAIDNAISDDFLEKPSWVEVLDYTSILVIGLLMGTLGNLPGIFSALIAVLLAGGYVGAAQWALETHNIWLTTTYQVVQIVLGFLVIFSFKYIAEERKRKQVKGAFEFYLNPQVVEQVIKDPDRLQLGGEKKNLSMLFSDVRGFTTISEALDAEELSALLNEYLTPMTDIVFDYDGTLDKYIGDALMAVFGAPLEYPDQGHAWRSCYVALEMMDALHELQPGWVERGLPDIDIGIGINTGEVSVGNMGSAQRFDYTVMGDAVNLAARLEGINKSYETHIVISEFTVREAGDKVFVRELDSVKVKGKLEPVVIYELVAKTPTEQQKNVVASFEKGLALYRARDFDAAIAVFEETHKIAGGYDGPSNVFINRCNQLKENMPPEGWDGVFTMTTK